MNIFHSILQKLGIEKPVIVAPAASAPAGGTPSMTPSSPAAAAAPAGPAAVKVVDVVKKLEGMAATHPGLDWKVSIVDLLKLVDMDSSFDARKALATELGCPANLMGDSAKMNVWLHQTMLYQIAQNGGNIPASMLK